MLQNTRSVQLAWFPTEETENAFEIFKKIAGQEPDGYQRAAPPQAPFPTAVYFAAINGRQHRIQIQPGRIDYFIEAGAPTASGFANLGTPSEVLSEALRRAKSAVDSIGRVTRLAIVTTMFEEINDAGYEIFSKLFGGDHVVGNGNDVIFQVNKRTTLTKSEVNRLLRWSKEDVSFEQVAPGPNGSELKLWSSNKLYVSYMIDVNTIPEHNLNLSGADTIGVLEELSAEAINLAQISDLREFK